MTAGIGSRFGRGIKQLEPVGLHGEIIMNYSIHDAIEAGFNKIVFIIRKDIKDDFKEVIGNWIEKICTRLGVKIAYAYQSLDAVPDGVAMPADRTKPWGTGQAVLAAKSLIQEPFAVINADDYYGEEAFRKIYEFLRTCNPVRPMDFCMAGFILKNTLSENGGVTRGICKVDQNGYLTDVVEISDIVKTTTGAAVNGEEIDAEYLLPIYIGQLLRESKVSVKVLETVDKWFGVTYKEDKEMVVQSFKKLISDGVYGEELYLDL